MAAASPLIPAPAILIFGILGGFFSLYLIFFYSSITKLKNGSTPTFRMIAKIKELMNVKSDIDEINRNIEENSRLIQDLKVQLESLKNDLIEAKKEQKELYEFKLLKGQLQRKILDKFEEELQKDLEVNRESLKKDAEDYNELRKKAAEILSRLNLTGEEMGKFLEISKSIKKEDFELTKFARHLIEMDKEKLDLMRKIDSLERLVSKMRRNTIVR